MPKLGHAARVRAHMRQISECVASSVSIIEKGGSLESIVSHLNGQGHEWRYIAGYADSDESHDVMHAIHCTSTENLLRIHEEITKMIGRWSDEGADDQEIDRAAGQLKELGTMAWALERQKRGQGRGSRYLTLDVDPITMRLLSFIHEAREDREDEGRILILENASLANALKGEEAESLKKARRALQRMINDQGDGPLLREEYQINGSDIPDLRSITITIENGSARSSVSFFGNSQIDYITDGLIKLRFLMAETQAAGFRGVPLAKVVQHPMTNGLGLVVAEVESFVTSQGRMSGIRTDSCSAGRLTAMVMNMETT